MGIPFYLAMTGAEIDTCPSLPEKVAYMACHFSLYTTGLSGIPDTLPDGSMLILNDRIPMAGHDPDRILQQLTDLLGKQKISSLLLDFQREHQQGTAALARKIIDELPIPVGVSPVYWSDGAAMFLPPIPPEQTAESYLCPHLGKELWLEIGLQSREIWVTTQGAHYASLQPVSEPSGIAQVGLCSYAIEQEKDSFRFRLFDTRQSLQEKLSLAEKWGISKFIGLYQEIQKPLC